MRDERLLPAITTAAAASVIAVIAVATATTIAATAVSAVAAIATATAAAITTATAAITATAVAATAAVATLSAGLGLVDTNRAVAEHGAVERLNGVARLRIVRHLDETEALTLAGGAIHDDRGVQNLSKRAEKLRKLLIVRAVGQIPYVNPGGH